MSTRRNSEHGYYGFEPDIVIDSTCTTSEPREEKVLGYDDLRRALGMPDIDATRPVIERYPVGSLEQRRQALFADLGDWDEVDRILPPRLHVRVSRAANKMLDTGIETVEKVSEAVVKHKAQAVVTASTVATFALAGLGIWGVQEDWAGVDFHNEPPLAIAERRLEQSVEEACADAGDMLIPQNYFRGGVLDLSQMSGGTTRSAFLLERCNPDYETLTPGGVINMPTLEDSLQVNQDNLRYLMLKAGEDGLTPEDEVNLMIARARVGFEIERQIFTEVRDSLGASK